MQTRKDLYQAHRLMQQRVSLALLQAEPDAVESPMRRMTVAVICGVCVAVLVIAGFGIWGLLFKGGARGLEAADVLIIEKETGTKYAYSKADRKLIPFLNYASARLAMPGTSIKQKSVSRRSLAKYTRGPVVGIVGAPDALPDRKKMARAPWSLCARDAEGQTGGTGPVVTLIGGRDVGGRALPANSAVIVRGGAQDWVVWNNQRMRVASAELGILTNDRSTPVAQKWLNGIPSGPDFAAPDIPGRGTTGPGPNGPGAEVGRVYKVAAVAGGGERWFVQMQDGLAPISQTEATLLINDQRSRGLPQPRDIRASDASTNASNVVVHKRELPERLPAVVPYDPAEPLCAVYRDTGKLSTAAQLTIGGTLPEVKTSAVTAPSAGPGTLDQVVLPGGGTLAGQLSTPNQPPQTLFLVTDQGIRFPIPKAEEAAKLGYDADEAAPVPANLLQLLPEGPALESRAATSPPGLLRPGG